MIRKENDKREKGKAKRNKIITERENDNLLPFLLAVITIEILSFK